MEISTDIAIASHGISTSHQQMENGELRFRLRKNDGTAYIRTEADKDGGWQNSHFHLFAMESYIVQTGWIGFAELIDGKMVMSVLLANDVVTTRPNVIHNVYLSANSVIHTVKHGSAVGDDRHTSDETSAFDKVTQSIKDENDIRAAAMVQPAKSVYSDEYRHFDTLIWQIPALSTAIFALSAQSFLQIFLDGDRTTLSSLFSGYFTVLLGLFSLTFSFTLYRFRFHQKSLKAYKHTPFWKSASTWSQCVISLQAFTLLGAGTFMLGLKLHWSTLSFAAAWGIWTIGIERTLRRT
jgi:hypothetical protein